MFRAKSIRGYKAWAAFILGYFSNIYMLLIAICKVSSCYIAKVLAKTLLVVGVVASGAITGWASSSTEGNYVSHRYWD